MKTLFIAALVGLLVVPVVGNANHHNRLKETMWDQIRHHQRVIAVAIAKREEARKAKDNTYLMYDAMKVHAKNAPDKLQRDWALRAKANLDKLRKQYVRQIEKFDKIVKDQQRIICGLYNIREVPAECYNPNKGRPKGGRYVK